MKKIIFLIVVISISFISFDLIYSHVFCENETNNTCSNNVRGHTSGTVSDSAKLCPVSGEPVDQEGTPVKYSYLGKEYTFCCNGCVKKFKAEPIKYIKEELLCPVMREPVDKNVSAVIDGVKYYFCCESCIDKFRNNPSKYLNKLNKN